LRRGGPDQASPLERELADDLGQVLWAGVPGTALGASTRAALARGAVGGVPLFGRNVGDLAAVRALCDAIRASVTDGPAPLVAIDQEGGRIQTIREPATRWPPMAALGAFVVASGTAAPTGAPDGLARATGRALGSELAALGVDVDFAPVLDLALAPASTVIGDRALAADPATVASLGGALAAGLADAGVLACGKHFPGHGGSAVDSHDRLPIDRSDDAALAAQLAPFAALAARLPMLMVGHVAYARRPSPGGPRPASLDEAIATGLLRDRLGFRGVLVSDNLEMGAVTRTWSIEAAGVAALRAGCDVLLLCHRRDSLPRVRAALWRALAGSPDLRARLRQAAARVRALKATHVAAWALRARPSLDVVGSPAHRALAATVVTPR
jgi:beta-N-acetylhexosaminidase